MEKVDQIDSHSIALVLAMCDKSGTTYAKRFKRSLLDFGLQEALRLPFNYGAYDSATQFYLDYGISKFLRKYEGVKKVSKLSECWAAYQKVDWTLKPINRRFKSDEPLIGVHSEQLLRAKSTIRKILGPLRVGHVLSLADWGPGATSTLKASMATVDNKITEQKLSVTRQARRYANAFLENDWHWLQARGIPVEGPICLLDGQFEVVNGGKFSSVPKDFLKDRSIDIQPTMNLFLQKGVGLAIREALCRVGINLNDQSQNQFLASRAQSLGLATIDLQNASDTVCRELVRFLLPEDWFQVLNDLRTHFIEGPEVSLANTRWYDFEKFSSMGNGFTFELESLIFYALADACRWRGEEFSLSVVSVYGDDIVISRELVDPLLPLLHYCGFVVNKEKSFVEGNFFESCGKHYFRGEDVTPPYQKEPVLSVPAGVRCANRILRWAWRIGGGVSLYGPLHSVWLTARQIVRRLFHIFRLRPLYQPHWLEGDFALIDPDVKFRFDINGFLRLKGFAPIVKKVHANDSALLALTMRRGCVTSAPFEGFVTPRSTTQKYRITMLNVWFEVTSVPFWAS